VAKAGVPIVHWVPEAAVEAEVLMTDGSVRKGLAERGIVAAKDASVQLERFGFVRVEQVAPTVRCVFTHK